MLFHRLNVGQFKLKNNSMNTDFNVKSGAPDPGSD